MLLGIYLSRGFTTGRGAGNKGPGKVLTGGVFPLEEKAWLPSPVETGLFLLLLEIWRGQEPSCFALRKEVFLPRNNRNIAEGPFCYTCQIKSKFLDVHLV